MAKVKTKTKVKKKTSRYYFTEDTENAIVKYNKLDPVKDYGKRNLLYEKEIYAPLSKMAEFLIHTFKFYYFDVPSQDVQKQVTAFMTSKLEKFNPDSGKAFSYFSIVGKNWLIYHNNKNYARQKTHRSTSSYSDKQKNKMMGEITKKMNKNQSQEVIDDYTEIIEQLAIYVEENIDQLWQKQRDKNIAQAVVVILKRHEQIETIHKKALYILIREYSGEKTMYITKVLNKIQTHYIQIKQGHYNNKIVMQDLMLD